MKQTLLIVILFCLILSLSPVSAQTRTFGLGLVLGRPTALSAKLWVGSTTALDFALGWRYWDYPYYYDSYYGDSRCYDYGFYRNHEYYCDNRAYGSGYRSTWSVLHLHADFLFHHFNVIKAKEDFPLYLGPGLNFEFLSGGYADFGIQGKFGIAWVAKKIPIDVFFELTPVLHFFYLSYFDPDLDLNAGIGVRYFF
jgi:hypothetical protein